MRSARHAKASAAASAAAAGAFTCLVEQESLVLVGLRPAVTKSMKWKAKDGIRRFFKFLQGTTEPTTSSTLAFDSPGTRQGTISPWRRPEGREGRTNGEREGVGYAGEVYGKKRYILLRLTRLPFRLQPVMAAIAQTCVNSHEPLDC